MNPVVLRDIPFRLNFQSLMKHLHIPHDASYAVEFKDLAREAKQVAKPTALYRPCYKDTATENSVTIDGITFRSRVLAVNLKSVHRTFPYIATCGHEIEEWSSSLGNDLLRSFWAEAVKEAALRAAAQVLRRAIVQGHNLGKTTAMSPGSLGDWPIQEQKPLFELLGDTQETIGVYLTESFLMLPPKSISGIWFPTDSDFESCQLCPRLPCPSRRAKYDPNLLEQKYQVSQ